MQSPAGLHAGRTGAWLVFLSGCHRGEDVRLPVGSTGIGSSWAADIVLTAPGLSSRHAQITLKDGANWIAPLGGDRLVAVNGERVSGQTALEDGDLISFADLHAIIRFAKDYAPGCRPVGRPRPALAPNLGDRMATYTVAWLVAASGARAGQDWRLIRGTNRLGSAMGLEITWPDTDWPEVACTLQCDLTSCVLASWAPELTVLVNDSPAKTEQPLVDSDRLQIGNLEFYLKRL